jgi:hypothetical protein
MQTKDTQLPQLKQFKQFVHITQGRYATWNQKDVPNNTCIVVPSVTSCFLVTIQSGDTITVGHLDPASCYMLDAAEQTIGSLIDDHNKKRGERGDNKAHLTLSCYDPKRFNEQGSPEDQNIMEALQPYMKSIKIDNRILDGGKKYGTFFSEYFLGNNAIFRIYYGNVGEIVSAAGQINGEVNNTWLEIQLQSVCDFLQMEDNPKTRKIFEEANNRYRMRYINTRFGIRCPAEKLDISEHLTQPSIFPSINKIEEDKTRSPIFPPIEKIVEYNPNVQFDHGFLKRTLGVKSYDEQLEKIKKTQQQESGLKR